jgi:hypothetical protein
MAFQVSPGIVVKEVDLTTIIPNVSTSIGATVIASDKGPAMEIVDISTEQQLAEVFGKPSNTNAQTWFSAANFLKYAGALRVVRAIDETAAKNASDTTGVLIDNDDVWENNMPTATGIFAARSPGLWGNSLKVSVCPSGGSVFTGWAHEALFDSAPGTSEAVGDVGGSNDEMHVVVIDEDGGITGVAGTVLETWANLSKAVDGKSVTGEVMYYKDKLFRSSQYIYWTAHPAAASGADWGDYAKGSSWLVTQAVTELSMAGGLDGVYPTVGDFNEGWTLFSDADTVDVNLLIAGPGDKVHAQNVMNIANSRKDCVCFISPEQSDVVGVASSSTQTNNVKDFFDDLNTSSYTVFDSGWKYQYDTYNDVFRWIPLNGDMAGLCAHTDDVTDPWFSPAGMNRGNVKSTVKLAFNPKKSDRDTLYKARINPVVTFPGTGTMLFGDKTAQTKASAFDRINVRRLFIVLEKAISIASRAQLFELNDEITRSNFVAMTEPFLRDVQGRRGITDFKVVCDTSNNTGDVIDRNEFRADIYIKPARSINFITLTFVAVRTGVSFTEVGA